MIAKGGAAPYRAGRAFENRCCYVLRCAGYYVQRSAGSGGIADIIALKPSETVLVQCKREGTIPAAEWNRLVAIAGELGCVAVLATAGATVEDVTFWRLTDEREKYTRTLPREPWGLDVSG